MTEQYQKYVDFIHLMNKLWQQGKFDTEEAEIARDEIDGVWDTLSSEEKKQLRQLSLDLANNFDDM